MLQQGVYIGANTEDGHQMLSRHTYELLLWFYNQIILKKNVVTIMTLVCWLRQLARIYQSSHKDLLMARREHY